MIAVLAIASGGDDDGGTETTATDADAELPASKTDDLDEAVKNAKAAGCVFKEFEDEGNQHLATPRRDLRRVQDEPADLGHARPAARGLRRRLRPGQLAAKEDWVHSLEHGRVILQYKPGTPQDADRPARDALRRGGRTQPGGYKTLLFENNTNMPFAVAAVVVDALRRLRQVHRRGLRRPARLPRGVRRQRRGARGRLPLAVHQHLLAAA